MLATLKRYSMALFFLILVVILMLGATLGVKSLGDNMFENTDIKMRTMKTQEE